MANRSTVPKHIKRGKMTKKEFEKNIGKGCEQPMNFKHGNAKKKRPDTGKKISRKGN